MERVGSPWCFFETRGFVHFTVSELGLDRSDDCVSGRLFPKASVESEEFFVRQALLRSED